MGRTVSQSIFHYPKGSLLSSYTQLYVGFLTSAVMHAFGAYLAAHRDLGEYRFFLSQAVAITFEDFVIACAKQLGYTQPTKSTKTLGYVWVLCWFTYSMRLWVNEGILGGVVGNKDVPLSLFRPFLGSELINA
jgi:Membrane bound O-acyl transferase family